MEDCEELRARVGEGVDCRELRRASEANVPRATLKALASPLTFSSMVANGLALRRCSEHERRRWSLKAASSESA